MKRFIYPVLVLGLLAAWSAQSASANALFQSRIRSNNGEHFTGAEGTTTSTNDIVFEVDFQYPTALGDANGTALRDGFKVQYNNAGELYWWVSDTPNAPGLGVTWQLANQAYTDGVSTVPLTLALDDGTSKTVLGQGALTYDHNWHHFAVSLKNEVAALTLDGNLVTTATVPTNVYNLLGRSFMLSEWQRTMATADQAGRWDNLRINHQLLTNFDNLAAGNGAAVGTLPWIQANRYTFWQVDGAAQSTVAMGGSMYLNRTGSFDETQNVVASDGTTNTDDIDLLADFKYPAPTTSAATYNPYGMRLELLFETRLNSLQGAGTDARSANSPAIEGGIAAASDATADNTGHFSVKRRERATANGQGSGGTSTISGAPFDHQWHRYEFQVIGNTATQFLDGVQVAQQALVASPPVAGDNFSVVTRINAVTATDVAPRVDNIKINGKLIDDFSSYMVGTTLRNDGTPWLDGTGITNGSNPSIMSIDPEDSNYGLVANAAKDWTLY